MNQGANSIVTIGGARFGNDLPLDLDLVERIEEQVEETGIIKGAAT